jgi:hypothetical protein
MKNKQAILLLLPPFFLEKLQQLESECDRLCWDLSIAKVFSILNQLFYIFMGFSSYYINVIVWSYYITFVSTLSGSMKILGMIWVVWIYLYGACFAAAIWEKICKEGPLSVLATGTALRTLNCCSLVEPKTQLNC